MTLSLLKSIKELKPEVIAVDTETYYNPLNKDAFVVEIKGGLNNEPFCATVYFEHEGQEFGFFIEDRQVMKTILEDPTTTKLFHNFKFDYHMLLNIGITVAGPIEDTMIMINLIDEEHRCKMPAGNMAESKKLEDLAFHYLDEDAHESSRVIKEHKRQLALDKGVKASEISYKDIYDAYPEDMKRYAINDVKYAYKLRNIFLMDIAGQVLYKPLRLDIEATLAIIDIERRGILVDQDRVENDKERLQKLHEQVVNDIHIACGFSDFNLNSNRELADMYTRLGVHWVWHTDSGEYDVAKPTLKKIKDKYSDEPAIIAVTDYILEYRAIEKLMTTYIDYKIHHDGKVHPNYWVIGDDFGKGGTVTGRLSSSDPNMQNIPKSSINIRGEEFNMRKHFIADEGFIIVSMDASQQEYRLLAHYGKDQDFMDYVHAGKDVHTATASMVYNVPYEEVTKEMRNRGKTTNFALVYGLGNASFAKSLGYDLDEELYRQATKYLYAKYKPWDLPPYKQLVDEEGIINGTSGELRKCVEYFFDPEVKAMIQDVATIKKEYFSQFPGINEFLKACKNAARRRGYVKTWVGRRRHFKDPQKDNYKAPNAVIQGGCSDILKSKLWECYNFLKDYKSCIINNVHDQIDFMIHESELELIPKLNALLTDTRDMFRVPITWDIEFGKTWGDRLPTTLETYESDIKEWLNESKQ